MPVGALLPRPDLDLQGRLLPDDVSFEKCTPLLYKLTFTPLTELLNFALVGTNGCASMALLQHTHIMHMQVCTSQPF